MFEKSDLKNLIYLVKLNLTIVLLASFILDIQAQNITRGPYLQMMSPSSTRIRFRTDNDSKPTILIGKSPKSLTRSIKQTTSTKEHELVLDSLSSNTRYYYQIVTPSQTLGDSTYFFQTAPAKGAKSKFSFWSTGDMYPGQAQLDVYEGFKKFIGNKYTNIYLTVGDNVYAGASDNDFQANFFQVYQNGPILKQSALFPSTGNHDYDISSRRQDDPTIAYFQNFTLPQKGELSGIPSNSEAYYSYDYGNTHFICLDSHAWGADNMRLFDGPSEQLNWLKKDLAANKQDWTVVYFHHPPYTKGTYDSDSNQGFNAELYNLRNILVPIFDEYHVDIVLTGHSHIFERSKPLKGLLGTSADFNPKVNWTQSSTGKYDASENSCPYMFDSNDFSKHGTVYIVNGVGGGYGNPRPDGPHVVMAYTKPYTNGSFYVEIENNRFDAKFIDASGNILDQFTIFKNLKLKPITDLTLDYGKSVDLNASWIGQYNWSTNQTSASITVNPTTSTSYQVSDPQKCFNEKYNVTVSAPLGTMDYSEIPFDHLTIYNLQGQFIQEISHPGKVNTELMHNIPQGSYILRIVYNQQEKVLKLVN